VKFQQKRTHFRQGVLSELVQGGHAETSTDPEVISTLVQKVYPGLSNEQRLRFVPGKVAITITLEGENEGAR